MNKPAKPIPENLTRPLLDFASRHPPVFSLLYDLDLLPEQVKSGSPQFVRMLNIIAHFEWMKNFVLKHDNPAVLGRDSSHIPPILNGQQGIGPGEGVPEAQGSPPS